MSSRSIETIGSGDFAKSQFRVGAHTMDHRDIYTFFWEPPLQGGFLDDLNPRVFFVNTSPFYQLKKVSGVGSVNVRIK